jgi:hypothetical protein
MIQACVAPRPRRDDARVPAITAVSHAAQGPRRPRHPLRGRLLDSRTTSTLTTSESDAGRCPFDRLGEAMRLCFGTLVDRAVRGGVAGPAREEARK